MDVTELLYIKSTYTFWVPEVNPTFTVSFSCTNGNDECEKRYLEKNWASIWNGFDPDAMYSQLSPILYHVPSTVQQCYTSSNVFSDCRGYCDYTSNPVPYYSCLSAASSGTPAVVTFQSNRAQSGPTKSDQDTLSILCNTDRCNAPTVVSQVKKLFGMKEPVSNALKNDAYCFIAMLSLFSVLQKNH